jgi:CDP-6-deoxy-D-xylo-4-hexulose-3-dehydrase
LAEKEVARVENHTILRTASVFGFDPGGKNFLMRLLGAKKRQKVPTDQVSNPTDVHLLCRYVGAVIDKDIRGTYVATGPQALDRYSFAQKIAKALDLEPLLFEPAKTSELGQKARRPLRVAASSNRLQKLTGIVPPSIEESLQRIKAEMTSVEGIEKSIFAQVKGYYAAKFSGKKFKPGEQYINAANKVFDSDELKNGVRAVLDGWWTEGRFALEFEKKLAAFLGVKYVALTNSGSSSNLVAFSSLMSPLLKERAIKPGDEVITVAAGFPTTVNPIIQMGCIPVFVDIDLDTLNTNPKLVEKAVTPKTKAIMIAHTLGNPFDLDSIMAVARKHNLWVVEDSCDALGAEWGKRKVGSIADIATFSFYPAHQMTMGEGGAVVTSNPLLYRIICSLRDWGRDCWCRTGKDNSCGMRFSQQHGTLPFGFDHKYVYSHLGYNLKLTDMQAAIGIAQLKKLPLFVRARRENKARLLKTLGKFSDYFIFQKSLPKANPCWFGFTITLKEGCPFTRVDLVSFLDSKKINTRPVFGGNLVRQPYFENVKYRVASGLSNTDFAMENTFWISCDPSLTDEKIGYIAEAFDEFVSKHAKGARATG